MPAMTPDDFMRAAIAEANQSQTPFGAVIVKDNQIVERSGNSVEQDYDPTAHAEVNVVRKLTTRLKTAALEPGYTLYTTCEPCPMCAATCIWAGISEIVYGVGVDDFEHDNPNQINLRCREIVAQAPVEIPIQRGVLTTECKALHRIYPLE